MQIADRRSQIAGTADSFRKCARPRGRLDPFPADTVDCSGGGNDRMLNQAPAGLKLVNCASGPSVTASIPRGRLRKFLSGSFKITLRCDKPCAIQWFMQGADRKRRRWARRARSS